MSTLTSLGIKAKPGLGYVMFNKALVSVNTDLDVEHSMCVTGDARMVGDLTVTNLRTPHWRYPKVVCACIADISTAGFHWFVVPFTGYITKISTVLYGTIATASAVVTLIKPITMPLLYQTAYSTVTIASGGSAAADIDTATLDYTKALDVLVGSVSAGDARAVRTSGASTNAVKVSAIIEISHDWPG